MPKSYPPEFRGDVVAVARKHEAPLHQIAKDFGISESCLANWLKKADVEEGVKPGVTEKESAELRPLVGLNQCQQRVTESRVRDRLPFPPRAALIDPRRRITTSLQFSHAPGHRARAGPRRPSNEFDAAVPQHSRFRAQCQAPLALIQMRQ